MSNREIKPKKFAPTAISDAKSVGIVNRLLPEDKFHCEIKANDKIPNEDGVVQCLSIEGYPLGKLEVQVKTLNQTRTKLAHSLELEVLAYAKDVQLPFILIVVDQLNELAYWLELNRSLSIELIDKALAKKPNQKSITINLDKNKELSNSNVWELWCEIIDKQKKILLDGGSLLTELEKKEDDLLKMSEQLDDHLPENDAKFVPINLFQEKLNHLINNEFLILKTVYRNQFWKFGINLFQLTENHIFYGLFLLKLSGNEKSIRQFKVNSEQYGVSGLSHPFSRGYGGHNPIIESPEGHAFERCKDFFQYLIKHEILWPKSLIVQKELVSTFKSQNFGNFDEVDEFSLVELKSSIEQIMDQHSHIKERMEKYPEMKFNYFRVLDYIQNIRLSGLESLKVQSNVKNSMMHLHLSFCNKKIFPIKTESILIDFWNSVINSYNSMLVEYFNHFIVEMEYHNDFQFEILVPISVDVGDGIDLKLARLFYIKLLKKPSGEKGHVAIVNDYNSLNFDWNKGTIQYNGEEYEFVSSGYFPFADIAGKELPIRTRIFAILKEKMDIYFKERI
jgi:hypothetical protein